MTNALPLLTGDEAARAVLDDEEAGFGALRTDRGVLPLKAMDVRGRIDGLLAQVTVRQTFVNALDQPLEATYIFPLPDRAAVTRFRMEVAGRVVEGALEERAQARKVYDEAIAAGHRAGIAEEERPGVFTLRVGNLAPGDEATVELRLAGPLPLADGEVTFRFPLVVAPRYVPGTPLPGPSVGDGVALDTDAVPDASRISPPVLLPGFPNPVRLALSVDVHESGLPVGEVRSSLHAVVEEGGDGVRRVSLRPGERLDRDFVLRYRLGTDSIASALSAHPDPEGDGREGTFALTIVPPASPPGASRPRDVALVLDRSGSMDGWKIVAARRALSRMVDTLGEADRFHVLAFDDRIETPAGLPADGLVVATDRRRFRAVEFLAAIDARGGTAMVEPLERAATVLSGRDPGRERILVLVTDGQVANEDQVLRTLARCLEGVRVFALGIDRAVNEAFLRRLAEPGGGSCEVVESEDRLDAVMAAVHRRIGTPVVKEILLKPAGLSPIADTLVPERFPDLFASAPVLVLGRYRGIVPDRLDLSGQDAAGRPWSLSVPATVRDNPAIASVWARGQVRKLEDRYVVGGGDRPALERELVATSLRFGVLCRFTAYVAVDRSEVVNEGGRVHRITQPVELPEGWSMTAPVGFRAMAAPRPVSSVVRAMACGDVTRSAPSPASVAGLPPAMAPMEPVCDSFLEEDDDEGSLAMGPLCVSRHVAFEGPPLPQEFQIRARALRDLLAEALSKKGAARRQELATLMSRIQELLRDLRDLRTHDWAVAQLEAVHEGLRRVVGRARIRAADVASVGKHAETVLALLAGTRPGGGPDVSRRESFWKP